jgi:hypothetical protein
MNPHVSVLWKGGKEITQIGCMNGIPQKRCYPQDFFDRPQQGAMDVADGV